GNAAEGTGTLAAKNFFREAGLALLDDLADAYDGRQPRLESALQLFVDRVVGLAKVLATFRVADDDMSAAASQQHGSGNLSREGALLLPVEVLAADGDV